MTDAAKPVEKRLVAIVVTHNRLAQIKRTLDRLLSDGPAVLHAVIVVDNASTDGTANWLQSLEDPRVTVMTQPTNTGGAGGFAAGMAHALAHFDPHWFLLMDDDARPEPETLARFQAGDYAGMAGVAAAVRHPDGRICDTNRPSINPFWNSKRLLSTLSGKGREGFHLGRADFETEHPQQIDIASFVGFFVRGEVVRAHGLPDPKLFIYADDSLYTFGLRQRGERLLFDPNLRFEHDYTTTRDGDGRFRPLWKAYYYHRNLLFLYREAAGWMFWPALLVVLPRWAMKLRDHKGAERIFLRLMRRAVWHGLTGRRDVTHEEVRSWSEIG